MLRQFKWTVLPVVAAILASDETQAQGLETLGNRASALAAFVAVADDASAVAWNPAGLLTGPIFNIALNLGRSTDATSDVPSPGARAGEVGTTLLALGVPPLGLSYYRVRTTSIEAQGSEVLGSTDRENIQVVVRSLVTSHLGATVLQSLGDYATVGATVKLVRGSVATGRVRVGTWNAGFDRAEIFPAEADTVADVDAGAMFAVRRLRAGIVVRNATEPSFGGEGPQEMTLRRHVRGGVAWGDGWPGLARTIVAVDVDLTRVPDAAGERRDLAAGVERWTRRRHVGIRGGLRASTVGEARPVLSGGLSYGVRAGTYLDVYVAHGRRDDRAWGVGARLTY